MINYLAKLSPRISEISETIRDLAKDKVPFNWGPKHQEAFTSLKKEIASAPMLAYYDPKNQTTLHTDSSIKGLGACLLQDSKPVYFASKALTGAKKGYAVIEFEALALAWAMDKFHHFSLCQSFSSWNRPEAARKLYYPKVLINLQQDCREYLSAHLHIILQWYTFQVAPTS